MCLHITDLSCELVKCCFVTAIYNSIFYLIHKWGIDLMYHKDIKQQANKIIILLQDWHKRKQRNSIPVQFYRKELSEYQRSAFLQLPYFQDLPITETKEKSIKGIANTENFNKQSKTKYLKPLLF